MNDLEFYNHNHSGGNSRRIDYQNLLAAPNQIVTAIVAGLGAATSSNYSYFWIAPYSCQVISIREIHQTAGTDAGAVTVQVEKRTGTNDKGGGKALLSTAFNLKATARTEQDGAITSTSADTILAVNDMLGLSDVGVLTNVNNVVVVVELKRI